jgi:hypothetical protein
VWELAYRTAVAEVYGHHLSRRERSA